MSFPLSSTEQSLQEYRKRGGGYLKYPFKSTLLMVYDGCDGEPRYYFEDDANGLIRAQTKMVELWRSRPKPGCTQHVTMIRLEAGSTLEAAEKNPLCVADYYDSEEEE